MCILVGLFIILDSLAELLKIQLYSAEQFSTFMDHRVKPPLSLTINLSRARCFWLSLNLIRAALHHPSTATKTYLFFLHFRDNTKVLRISQCWKFQRRAVGVARRRVEDSTMCSSLLSSPKTTAVFGKVCLNRGDEEVDSGRPYTNTHRVCNRGKLSHAL